MTQLKEVLHLYLPVPVELDNGGSKVYNRVAVGCGNMDDQFRYVKLRTGAGAKSFAHSVLLSENRVKPILHRLEDMREEQARHIWIEGTGVDYTSANIRRLLYSVQNLKQSAPIITALHKAGYDLFGLIESGQAIDAKTLNQKVK